MTVKQSSPRNGAARQAVRFSRVIWVGSVAYLVLGLFTYIAWRISGNIAWIDGFFHGPGGLFMVSLALVQLVYGVRVRRQFTPGEPLYTAWGLISLSAGCDLFGSLAAQILSAESAWNPIGRLAGWSHEREIAIQKLGLALGGPVRFTLLAAGLLFAVRVYRKSGFLGRITPGDFVVLAIAVLYVLREARDLVLALANGKHPELAEIVNWPVDPLLCVLLAEAMVLYRSTQRMGPGWVGRCWLAFSIGIVLIILGDVCIWATNYGFLPYPWSSIGWYVWLPAASAFALAPVYQMEVIQTATAN